jgi:hypothetical protein
MPHNPSFFRHIRPILDQRSVCGLALCVLFFMTGCTVTPPVKEAGITSLSSEPIRLKVGSVNVVKHYIPTEQPPFIDHWMTPTPMTIVSQWLQDRFLTTGKGGRATITVEDASLMESIIPAPQTPFSKTQLKYTGHLAIRLDVWDSEGRPRGAVQGTASAARTVPESLNLLEKEKIWLDLVEEMINQLDRSMTPKITQFLGEFTG